MAYTAPVSMNADGCNSNDSIFKVMRLRILIEQGDGGGGGGGGGADGGVTPSIQLMRRLKETARVYVLTLALWCQRYNLLPFHVAYYGL